MALLTLGSVGDLGATPATAVLGLASVVIYVLPAIVFLLPASLVSAELASGWKGGVYNWVSEGISPRMGFVAIWCQFAQTTFYYPAVLAYVASTLAYVFAPSLAHSGLYTTVVIIVLFWAAVLVSARGVLSTGRLASYGIFIGTLIPGLLLVVLAAIYLLQGNASAAPLNAHHVLPAWHGLTSVVLIVNSFFLYAGVEVNAVHVDELRDAPREFPKATLLGRGTDPARLHLPDARDLGRGPRGAHQLHRGRHAGVQEPARSLRPERADADHRRRAGRRLPEWPARLAHRSLDRPCWTSLASVATCRGTSRSSTQTASSSTYSSPRESSSR